MDYDDLVGRLSVYGSLNSGWAHCTEAATAITTLSARVRELEGVLRRVADAPLSGWTIAQALARKALDK